MTHSTPIRVVAAVLRRGTLYLAAQRPADKHLGLKWEFPGGKIEPGEAAEEALKREILEELGCMIVINEQMPAFIHSYGSFAIEMNPFIATLKPESPEPHPHEHASIKWLSIDELQAMDLAEADIPVINWLKTRQ